MNINFLIGYIMFPIARHLPYSDTKIVGRISKKIRVFFARMILNTAGKDINIEKGALFSKDCSIGSRSGIGVNAKIYGKVTIGNDVMMGPDCIIYASNHNFSDISMPMNQQGGISKPVTIKDDVWIGARVTILAGVTIESHSVIAAGAVVTHDVPEFAVVGGVPAKVIKIRK